MKLFIFLFIVILFISCNGGNANQEYPKYVDAKDSVEQCILDSVKKSKDPDVIRIRKEDSLMHSKASSFLLKIMSKVNCDAITANEIHNHYVKIGMTELMCIEACGRPLKINTTITAYKKHEQWCYNSFYLYFDNGVLSTIQQ